MAGYSQGMNTDTVRELASQIDSTARDLRSIDSSIERVMENLARQWEGGDYQRFRGWWRDQHRPSLHRLVDSIEGLARSARYNADDQDRTSASASPSSNPPALVMHSDVTAGAGPWFSPDISELISSAGWNLAMVTGVAGDIAEFGSTLPKAEQFGSWMQVGATTSTALTALGGGKALWDLNTASRSGDVDGSARAALDLAWIAASKASVHVAAGKAAWDVGWFVGDRIYDVGEAVGVTDWYLDTTISDVVANEYGGVVTDELSTRYDGFTGFGNYVKDTNLAMARKLKFW